VEDISISKIRAEAKKERANQERAKKAAAEEKAKYVREQEEIQKADAELWVREDFPAILKKHLTRDPDATMITFVRDRISPGSLPVRAVRFVVEALKQVKGVRKVEYECSTSIDPDYGEIDSHLVRVHI
tara:strand:+ start:2450 stop:2836 length:387 start_codon:yes stop_codon:yes gene_type:complete